MQEIPSAELAGNFGPQRLRYPRWRARCRGSHSAPGYRSHPAQTSAVRAKSDTRCRRCRRPRPRMPARALAKIHLWEAGTDLRAWLFSILHNQYVTQGRRSTREGTSVAWSACAPALTCAPCQIDHLESRELERAIKSLPEQQRTAVLLISLTRRNYYEVAAACDVPVGTIRSRLARGRKALRALTGIAPPQPRISARREASPKSCAGAKLPNLARGASVVG